jgi:CheY-like chemotaxis protein
VACAGDYAVAAGAKRLALFHHDPDRDDAAVDGLLATARERVAAVDASLEVFAATEGQELELRSSHSHFGSAAAAPDAGSALLASVPPAARTVLLAEDDPELALRLAAVLSDDGLRLVHVTELAAALDAARLAPPSLLLLDLSAPRSELLEACRKLRSSADPRLREMPVLLVASSTPDERELRETFEAGATDYLSRPIKPTLLRSRIRGWLLRSQLS